MRVLVVSKSLFVCIFDFVCISFHHLNCLMNVVINFKKP